MADIYQYFSVNYDVQNALDPSNIGKQFLFLAKRVFLGAREKYVGILERIEGQQIVIAYNTFNADGTILVNRITRHFNDFKLYKISTIIDNRGKPIEDRLLRDARLGGTKKLKYKKSKKLKYKKSRK